MGTLAHTEVASCSTSKPDGLLRGEEWMNTPSSPAPVIVTVIMPVCRVSVSVSIRISVSVSVRVRVRVSQTGC